MHKMVLRFGVTTADQCVSSLSNFVVGVGVARLSGVAGFGAYSLVYTGWLILASVHRAVVTDPMAISNDLRTPNSREHLRLGLAAELHLGIAAGVIFAIIGLVLLTIGQYAFGICFLGLAPWLPCLVAQDYWRWASFMKSRPQSALSNDTVFVVVQLSAFAGLYFATRSHSPLVPVFAWGLGATAGAAFGLLQFSVTPSLRGGIGRLRLRWSISKWLLATTGAVQATAQSTPIITGALLGPAGVGGLKSAMTLVTGPSMVLIQAGGSVGLPEASRELKEKGWPGLRTVARVVTLAGLASVAAVTIVVFLFGQQLLEFLYGPEFGQFATIADILAVGYLFSTLNIGPILCMKATRQVHRMVPVAVVSLVVSTIAIVVLAPRYGVTGAAIGTVVGLVTSTLGLILNHLWHSRRTAEELWNSGEEAWATEPRPSGQPTPALLTPGTFAPEDVELAVIAAEVEQ